MFTKSLSRIALVSGLILGATALVPRVAFAADEAQIENQPYAQVTYTKGTVPTINLLTQVFAETTLNMGSVNVKSNGVTGFNVSVAASDATSVKLNNATHAMDIDYKVQYVSQTAVTPTTTAQMVGTEEFSPGCASSIGCDRAIKLVIPGDQWATEGVKAGTYKASLTFTIANK